MRTEGRGGGREASQLQHLLESPGQGCKAAARGEARGCGQVKQLECHKNFSQGS